MSYLNYVAKYVQEAADAGNVTRVRVGHGLYAWLNCKTITGVPVVLDESLTRFAFEIEED